MHDVLFKRVDFAKLFADGVDNLHQISFIKLQRHPPVRQLQ
jgi:hypothetical protein